MVWQGNPRTTTPRWRTTRLRILNRDAWTCTVTGCGARANEVDHIIPWAEGGTDEDSNLASLCTPHHATKTAAEGNRARWHRNPRRRPPEKHPGLKGGG